MEMNLEQLNENRIEEALIKLSSTDQSHAALGGQVKYLEEALKQAKAHSFLLAEGTVAERDAKAIASLKFDEALKAHTKAFVEFKTLDNQRNHEIRIIDIWRTLSSNRRQGNM
jgi:methylmalonyl-CoA mutase cobalamin-binding subunit